MLCGTVTGLLAPRAHSGLCDKKRKTIEKFMLNASLTTIQYNTGPVVLPSEHNLTGLVECLSTCTCDNTQLLCLLMFVMCAAHLWDVANRLGREFELDRSVKDKRLLSVVNNLAQDGSLILSLPFEDSDITGPFCNGMSFLEDKTVKRILHSQLGANGFTIKATDKTPWTAAEEDILENVIPFTLNS